MSAAPQPQEVRHHAVPSRSFCEFFVDFLDELRKCQTMTDVNLAAGVALAELACQNPEGFGQVLHLPFNSG